MAIDPYDPNWVYAGFGSYDNGALIFRSWDNGVTWQLVLFSAPYDMTRCLEIDPVTTMTIYAGTYWKALKSTNRGATWFPIMNGLPHIEPDVLAMEVDPNASNTVYAGLARHGVYKSENAGGKWVPTGLTETQVGCLAVDPLTSSTVYAGTPEGVFKTTDAGSNWFEADNGILAPHIVALVDDPVEPAIVYSASKNQEGHGYAWISVDGGLQWVDMSDGLPDTFVNDLALDEDFPDTVYAATSAGTTYCFRSPWEHKPLTSSSSYATAYNGGRKLCRVPNTDELWIAYESGGGVFVAHSPDGGEHWQPKTFLGTGGFPTIAVTPPPEQGPGPLPYPVVVWTGPEQVWCARFWDQEWEVALLDLPTDESPRLPSMVIDTDYYAYLAWETWETVGLPPNERRLNYGTFRVDDPYQWPAEFEAERRIDWATGIDWFMAPCINLDYISAPVSIRTHIVYKKDDGIYYVKKEAGVWSSPVMISRTDHTASFPFIDIYGEDMHALWHAHDASQPDDPEDIWYCTKTVNEPYWPQHWDNVSDSPSWESQFPCMAAAFASWSEEWAFPAGNWEVGMKEEPFGDPMVNISESDELSKYSHVNYWQSAPTTHNLFFLWTEGNGPIYTVPVTQVVLNHPPVPYLYVRTGQEQPSFYCVERDGFIQFGPEAYQQVDIGADQLIYRLPGLMPWMHYQLKVTGYLEGEDEIREWLDIDGLDQRLIKLEPGVPETLTVWISPAAYKDDKEVDVTISLISGEWALTGPIVLYQFEREEDGEGGSQVAATPQLRPQSFSLSQNFPNPVVHSTAIDYQLPVSGFASLRIYDTSGRLVRTLVDEPTEMGYHRARWNGVDDAGRPVANGIYFYRLEAGSFTHTNKMVVLK